MLRKTLASRGYHRDPAPDNQDTWESSLQKARTAASQRSGGPCQAEDLLEPRALRAGSRAPGPEAAVDPHTWQGLSAHSKAELSVTHPLRFP